MREREQGNRMERNRKEGGKEIDIFVRRRVQICYICCAAKSKNLCKNGKKKNHVVSLWKIKI